MGVMCVVCEHTGDTSAPLSSLIQGQAWMEYGTPTTQDRLFGLKRQEHVVWDSQELSR